MNHCVNLMYRYQRLFNHPQTVNIRENDYLRPLFEIIFPLEGNIRVIAAESINPLFTESKNEQYPDSSSIHGFKADFRFIVDSNGKEIDVGVGECAKDYEDTKTINDSGKLLRESKEAVDGLVRLINNSTLNFKVYSVQCTGTSCIIRNTELVASGLYITNFVYSFKLPSKIAEFESLLEILRRLITFKRELNNMADNVLSSSQEQSSSPEAALNRSQIQAVNEKLSWLRETWHTPPQKTEPRLPSFFSSQPITPPGPPIFREIPTDEASTSTMGTPDVYGLVKTPDNKYYNVHLKKCFDKHPVNDA